MKIFSAIDIGSISVRLLVAELNEDTLIPLHQELEITRLGTGVGVSGFLEQGAMERTLSVLRRYRTTADKFRSEEILAVGTSAMRDAKNGKQFSDALTENSRIKFRILDGEQEARLTFGGATADLKIDEPVMLIDVGGGSTELICGTKDKIDNLFSIDAGAVRMTDRFIRNDPVDITELCSMKSEIRNLLESRIHNLDPSKCSKLIGVGGTVTSIAAMILKLEKYETNRIHGFNLSKEQVDYIVQELATKTLDERKVMKGLQSERADIILAGAVIVQIIMERFCWSNIAVSESDILSGIIWSYLGLIPQSPFMSTS